MHEKAPESFCFIITFESACQTELNLMQGQSRIREWRRNSLVMAAKYSPQVVRFRI